MFKVICPSCKAENKFENKTNVPVECSFCWENIPEGIEIIEVKDDRDVSGLTIIYQTTQQRIEIPITDKVILGRENLGSDIFSQILSNEKPVISRKHCSIEFKDGIFYLLDEGSLNGTYYGVNKTSCKNTPQIIDDKSIFYIGNEPFIAQINFTETTLKEEINHKPDKEPTKKIKCYQCNDQNCSGYESPVPFDICPVCGAWKKSIEIYMK